TGAGVPPRRRRGRRGPGRGPRPDVSCACNLLGGRGRRLGPAPGGFATKAMIPPRSPRRQGGGQEAAPGIQAGPLGERGPVPVWYPRPDPSRSPGVSPMWIPKWVRDRKKGVDSPVPTQVVSNEEFIPRPQNTKQQQVEELIGRMAEEKSKKLGMGRREFMASSMGMATAFLASDK